MLCGVNQKVHKSTNIAFEDAPGRGSSMHSQSLLSQTGYNPVCMKNNPVCMKIRYTFCIIMLRCSYLKMLAIFDHEPVCMKIRYTFCIIMP